MASGRPGFSAYLNGARKAGGFSYQQLAIVTGIPRNTIVRLCLGQVREPRSSHLVKIAQQLELPIAEVFELAGLDLPLRDQAPVNASLKAHLRAEYDLTQWEIDAAMQSLTRIIAKHGARQQRISTNNNRKEGHYEHPED